MTFYFFYFRNADNLHVMKTMAYAHPILLPCSCIDLATGSAQKRNYLCCISGMPLYLPERLRTASRDIELIRSRAFHQKIGILFRVYEHRYTEHVTLDAPDERHV